MPNGDPHGTEYLDEERDAAREVRRMLIELCDACQDLPGVPSSAIALVDGLPAWYEQVLARRSEQREREKAKKRQAELKEQALGKLTPEEREAVERRW
jgi:hypothetical protein